MLHFSNLKVVLAKGESASFEFTRIFIFMHFKEKKVEESAGNLDMECMLQYVQYVLQVRVTPLCCV